MALIYTRPASDGGNPSGGGSPTSPTTLKRASQIWQPGDRVLMRVGFSGNPNYSTDEDSIDDRSVVIPSGTPTNFVSIEPNPGENPVLRTHVWLEGAKYIHFKRIKFNRLDNKQAFRVKPGSSHIFVDDCDFTIDDPTVSAGTFIHIYFEDVSYCRMRGCTFGIWRGTDQGDMIRFKSTSRCAVIDCDFMQSRDGVLAGATHMFINVIDGCNYLWIKGCAVRNKWDRFAQWKSPTTKRGHHCYYYDNVMIDCLADPADPNHPTPAELGENALKLMADKSFIRNSVIAKTNFGKDFDNSCNLDFNFFSSSEPSEVCNDFKLYNTVITGGKHSGVGFTHASGATISMERFEMVNVIVSSSEDWALNMADGPAFQYASWKVRNCMFGASQTKTNRMRFQGVTAGSFSNEGTVAEFDSISSGFTDNENTSPSFRSPGMADIVDGNPSAYSRDQYDTYMDAYKLADSSPGEGTGGHLTKIAAGDSGSGATIRVEDALFFQAGDSTLEIDSDRIIIKYAAGGESEPLEIISINDTLTPHQITLGASVPRTVGDEVYLEPMGTLPDKGLFTGGVQSQPVTPTGPYFLSNVGETDPFAMIWHRGRRGPSATVEADLTVPSATSGQTGRCEIDFVSATDSVTAQMLPGKVLEPVVQDPSAGLELTYEFRIYLDPTTFATEDIDDDVLVEIRRYPINDGEVEVSPCLSFLQSTADTGFQIYQQANLTEVLTEFDIPSSRNRIYDGPALAPGVFHNFRMDVLWSGDPSDGPYMNIWHSTSGFAVLGDLLVSQSFGTPNCYGEQILQWRGGIHKPKHETSSSVEPNRVVFVDKLEIAPLKTVPTPDPPSNERVVVGWYS